VRNTCAALVLVSVLSSAAGRAHAQQPDAPSVTLATLHRAAQEHDARSIQTNLLAHQASLRTATIARERRPAITTIASAQYLSDVAGIGSVLPGTSVPAQPHDQYDAYVSARQRVYDATRARRVALERAQLTEQLARVQSALYRQRQQVSDAFFTIVRADVQRELFAAAITDLTAQRRVAASRREHGAALASDVTLLDAELLRRGQAISALAAERRAAIRILSSLTGTALGDSSRFTLPMEESAVAQQAADAASVRLRPEYAQYDAARALLTERRALLRAQDAPRISSFARAGYGRPGLNPLARAFDTYWLAGVQVEWSPWNWGSTQREHEVQRLQERIVISDEAAFTRELNDAALRLQSAADELTRTIASDAEIVRLRTGILAEARARFAERVITSAELVDRETDLLASRLDRALHVVQRSETLVRLYTLQGRDVP
jgi:outer membrane protein TolC